MGQKVMTGFHRWFLVGCFGGYQVGEDVLTSGELGVVIGDFTVGIVILRFCDGIVLGFFGDGHVVVIGVLEVGFSSIMLIEVML